jgi:hypothetical protein
MQRQPLAPFVLLALGCGSSSTVHPARSAVPRLLACLVLLVAALPATAQSPAPICFRGRPLPVCRAYLVTEWFVGSISNQFAGSGFAGIDQYGPDDHLGLRGGLMANVTPRLAVGLAGVVTTHGTGVEPRVRYWTPPYGVDLYGGYRWDDRRRHVNVGLSVMLWDRFGFFGTHEWGLNGFSRDQFSLGIALGGEPGAVAIAATVLYVTALLSGLKNLH